MAYAPIAGGREAAGVTRSRSFPYRLTAYLPLGRALAAACLLALVTGCDRSAEDRAADAAEQTVREANRALNKAGAVAREGTREAVEFARKTGEAAKTGAAEAGRALNDGALSARVKTALLADETVAGSSIDVDASAGVVTLSGRLPSAAQVERAVEIARSIEGVARVENRLTSEGA